MSDVLLRATDISKTYTLWRRPADRLLAPAVEGLGRHLTWAPPLKRWAEAKAARMARPFPALQPLSFAVPRGESVGVIGRNGSGKSTLLQILAGTLTPSSGSIQRYGKMAALLELGSGFNFEFTGRENVNLQGAIYGLSQSQMDGHFAEVAEFADIGEFIEHPVKTYSSGMMVRLAFAVQVVLRPDVLLVDEALSVGDVFFQAKCATYFRARLAEGMSLIFVTHDLVSVRALCRTTIVLHQGVARFHGPSKEAVSIYHELHSGEAKKSRQAVPAAPAVLAPPPLRNWQTSDEIGTREAEFTSCEVFDETGRSRRDFVEGETIRVRLRARTRDALPTLHSAFQIVDRHNRALYGVSTIHRESAGLDLPAGASAVMEFEIPGQLGAGEYLLDVVLGWGDRGDGAFTHQCHRIGGIASLAIGRTSLRTLFLGPVDLKAPLEWRAENEPAGLPG